MAQNHFALFAALEELDRHQRGLIVDALRGPGEGQFRGRVYNLIHATMILILVSGLHDDSVRPAHPNVELRLGSEDIPGTHPMPDAFRIRPGGEYLVAGCR